MWQVWVVAVCSLTLLTAGQEYKEEDEAEDDDFIPYNGQRYDRFDWQLCSALDHREPGNVIASTLSVKLLLSMIYQGAGGETKRQLETILQLASDKSLTAAKASVLLKSLKVKSPYYEVELGSKIYLDHKLEAKHWYQRNLQNYDTFVDTIDFNDHATAAHIINTWVDTVTRGKIHELISDPEVLEKTVMLLVNAVYFKGKWSNPFDPAKTYKGTFLGGKGPDPVEFMTQSRYFYYTWSEELASQIIRLPYKGKRFGMYIILPDNPKGLDRLQQTIKPFILRREIWELEQVMLELILPKFKIEFTANLKDLLQKIGISTIFESGNDLIGIKKRKSMTTVVSNVIQKAMIEVDEKGTKSAVATGFSFGNKFGGGGVVFNASHPFLFFIEDEKTGTVVFIGKYINPRDTVTVVDLPHKPQPLAPEYPYEQEGPAEPEPMVDYRTQTPPRNQPSPPPSNRIPYKPVLPEPMEYRTSPPPPNRNPYNPSYQPPPTNTNQYKPPPNYYQYKNPASTKQRGSVGEANGLVTTNSPPLINHVDEPDERRNYT